MPTGPAQATPAMVEQMGTLEEAELTKDGVRPLTEPNATDPSQNASPAGAAAEPAAQTAEAQPVQTAQAPEAPAQPAAQPEAPAPVIGQTPPAVEVISGTPPQTAQAPAAQAPAPAAAPAEVATEAKPAGAETPSEAERLEGLKTFGEQQAEEARRSAQASADRRAALVDRQLQEANERSAALSKEVREIKLRDLTEEERAAALAKYEQDDRAAELDGQKTELLGLQRDVYMDSLLLEFGEHGVTHAALEQIETPEEMELFCERQKSSSLAEQLKNGGSAPAQPAAQTPAEAQPPVAQQPAPAAAPAKQPEPQVPVPAGALAPSDVGGGGAPVEEKTFSDEQGDSAMRDNLRNMQWDTVRLR